MNIIKAILRKEEYREREEYGTIRLEVEDIKNVPINYRRYIYEYDERIGKYIVHKIMSVRQAVNVIMSKYNDADYTVFMRQLLRQQHVHGFSMEDLINIYGECIERATDDVVVSLNCNLLREEEVDMTMIDYNRYNTNDYI